MTGAFYDISNKNATRDTGSYTFKVTEVGFNAAYCSPTYVEGGHVYPNSTKTLMYIKF